MQDALRLIARRAGPLDQSGDWPADDLRALEQIGAMKWAIPATFGGDEIAPLALHEKYESIAAASLATALVLSQRDSAAGIIAAGANEALKQELLPRLAGNEIFATVGIAQLGTSRQRGAPAALAHHIAGGFSVSGLVPWSTGADRADQIIVGAVVPDEGQILFALPRTLPGVAVDPPMPLVALRASHTCSIRLSGVTLTESHVIAGPAASVLSIRTRSLPTGQAFLALGLVRGAIDLIGGHDSDRARQLVDRFSVRLAESRAAVIEHCRPGAAIDAATSARLRGECNDLALRATHSAVALYKGTALLAGHPAQRLAREAMFLLVWSCPDPVIDCTVDLLSGG